MSHLKRLFIIGAPKCATTAFCEELKRHRQISFCKIKEPHFFSDDISWQRIKTIEKYEALFPKRAGTRYAAEGSVFYLYSPSAIEKINNIYPDSKFISIIRNPSEIAKSLYAENRKNGWEECATFDEAWSKEQHRKANPKPRNPHSFYYSEVPRLGTQITRASKIIGKNNLLILIFDDLVKNPVHEFDKVQNFLGIDDLKIEYMKVANESNQYRNMAINRMITAVSDHLGMNFFAREPLRKVAKFMRSMNTADPKKPEISLEISKLIIEHFRPEVEILEQHLQTTFNHWKN